VKKFGFLSAIASVILALAFGLFVRSWLVKREAKASSLVQLDPAESSARSVLLESSPSDTTYPSGVDDASRSDQGTGFVQLTQSVGGIEVSATHLRRAGEQISVDVCFDMPDHGDWMVWVASLQLGGEELPLSGAKALEIRELPINGQQRVITFDDQGHWMEKWELANADQKGRRCDALYFNVRPIANLSYATLTVDWLAAEPREGEECTTAYLEKVQNALERQKVDIQVQCYTKSLDSGGSSGLRILSKPASMSMEEAESILFSQEMFLYLHGIRGPWVFTFHP